LTYDPGGATFGDGFGGTINDDLRYFLTGDLGSIEEDGRVRFRDRLKEIIKTGGVNVAPLEVEQVLLQNPDIVQAYVVAVPDELKGEIVAAAVEVRAGAASDTAAIVAFCRERLASCKVPARLAFRKAADFPRTPTGKIHKPRLRQELAADTRHDEGTAMASDDPRARWTSMS
jgi:fatty-acyl-CoA synthase